MVNPKNNLWSVRIDQTAGVTLETITQWCNKYHAILCVQEDPDEDCHNVHYHIALRLDNPVSQETVRNWVKQAFKDKPKKTDWSTAQWDGGLQFLQYCAKGPDWRGPKTKNLIEYRKPTTVVIHDSIDIDALHAAFWETNKIKGEVQPSQVQFNLDQVYEEVHAMKITNYYIAVQEITTRIVAHYKGKINDHVLFPQVQHILWRLNATATTKNITERMLTKLGPRQLFTNPSQPTGIYDELISHE